MKHCLLFIVGLLSASLWVLVVLLQVGSSSILFLLWSIQHSLDRLLSRWEPPED